MHNKGTKLFLQVPGTTNQPINTQCNKLFWHKLSTPITLWDEETLEEIWAQMEKGVELALDQKALINPSTFDTKSIWVKG
jgi:hypothetical protein